jgi:hypothetical protein
MRRVGQVRRRDTVEASIVEALQSLGAVVIPISGKGAPDLLVVFRGKLWAAEIKTGKGTLTKAQTTAGAGTLWPIWRTVTDAFTALGVDA